MSAEKATLVLGGAVAGVVSFAAYQKFTQKPARQLPPAVIQPPRPPQQQQQQQVQQPTNNVEKAREILPFGFPGPVSDLVYRNAYVTSFNRRDRNPNWVAEHLTAAKLKRGDDVDRQKSTFKEDDSVPPQFRAKLADYFRSGFDRGHMVPAADVKNSQVSMNETFYLTNISPQVGEGFNRDCKVEFFIVIVFLVLTYIINRLGTS
jgi:endonuclease G